MDKFFSDVSAFAVPGLLLKWVMSSVPHQGAPKHTAALAIIGGGKMKDGIPMLILLALVTRKLVSMGFSIAYMERIKSMYLSGMSAEEISRKIDGWMISDELKSQLRDILLYDHRAALQTVRNAAY